MALFYHDQQLFLQPALLKQIDSSINKKKVDCTDTNIYKNNLTEVMLPIANHNNCLVNLTSHHETPFYLYDINNLVQRYQFILKNINQQNCKIFYAVKANSNNEILQQIKKLGGGVDIVSGGELELVKKNGFNGQNIIFSGVGKTIKEITAALEYNVQQLNVESPEELIRIAQIAQQQKKRAKVAFRMNPDVNPLTHPYITTGFRDNKFGMDGSFMPILLEILKTYSASLDLVGLTMHIGSQLIDLDVITEALTKLLTFYQEFINHGFQINSIDVGGGIGIFYEHDENSDEYNLMANYLSTIQTQLAPYNCQIYFEPGRWLIARAGVLITQVQYIKKAAYKNFVIVDTGMHHLMRPALYQAYHRIIPLIQTITPHSFVADVVGPICESSDYLGKDRLFNNLNAGDYLVIADVGAYGYTMSSSYNSHQLAKEVFI